MKFKTYNLNTAARERLADWVYDNHKLDGITSPIPLLTLTERRERANHAAGACVDDCVLCRPCVISHGSPRQWALDTANSHAENFEGCAHVELAHWETYSGHTECVDFVESDFDVTEEEDDGEPDDGDE
jgi:hypothetical protein